jgi:hypothetical protein
MKIMRGKAIGCAARHPQIKPGYAGKRHENWGTIKHSSAFIQKIVALCTDSDDETLFRRRLYNVSTKSSVVTGLVVEVYRDYVRLARLEGPSRWPSTHNRASVAISNERTPHFPDSPMVPYCRRLFCIRPRWKMSRLSFRHIGNLCHIG